MNRKVKVEPVPDYLTNLVKQAGEKAISSNKICYIVKSFDGYSLTDLKPHCLEWKKRKYEWVRTVKPTKQ